VQQGNPWNYFIRCFIFYFLTENCFFSWMFLVWMSRFFGGSFGRKDFGWNHVNNVGDNLFSYIQIVILNG
jgi:hypothetical protein